MSGQQQERDNVGDSVASNVIWLAPFQAARAARRVVPRPYLMWYPGLGFVQVATGGSSSSHGHGRIARDTHRTNRF
jgi:hypothetical protein